MVRNIKSWDLLIVEQGTAFAHPDWTKPRTGSTRRARDHVERLRDFLDMRQIHPRIEEIARFWRRYFKVKA